MFTTKTAQLKEHKTMRWVLEEVYPGKPRTWRQKRASCSKNKMIIAAIKYISERPADLRKFFRPIVNKGTAVSRTQACSNMELDGITME